MNKGKARLEEVAERANVSKMTVSLCLRGDGGQGRMAPATRERVLNAIAELGYKPDLRARALRLGKTNVLAFYAGYGFINVRSPFLMEIVSGLQEGCEIAEKDLLLHGTFHRSSSEDIFGELVSGQVDGLIVNMPTSDPLVTRLIGSDFALVAIADAIDGVPSIVVDDAAGAEMIARHLFEQGHRRVAYAVNEIEPESGRIRRDRFMEVANGLGMQVEVISSLSPEGCREALQHVLTIKATAIACWNDLLAREMVDRLVDMGIEVPKKVAVTGFDGCPMPCREAIPLTTIAAPWSEVAKSAVLQLNARLSGEEVAPRIVLPVRLVRGATS